MLYDIQENKILYLLLDVAISIFVYRVWNGRRFGCNVDNEVEGVDGILRL
jgi:hypothetical protein